MGAVRRSIDFSGNQVEPSGPNMTAVPRDLPSGTVTFLFTDVEGSTKLLHALGPTGTPHIGEEGYIGTDVHRAARIAAAGHGGQVLVSAATAALVATDGLRDLGEHRLKDLSAPERIYQLGHADFPSLKSLHQTNLPILATPFLGRGQEVAEVTALLNRAAVRLLTLTGPGGTGKTRLALQSATASTATFAGGVWWVPLRRLRCHDEQTPPVRPSPQDAMFLVPYLGLAILMFGSLGLALAFPRPLPLAIIFGLVVAGAYGLARLYVSYR